MTKKLLILYLAVAPMHIQADYLWDLIKNNPITTTAILGALALAGYGGHVVAHAAGNNVQERAEELANHLSEVVNNEVLPQAEMRSKDVIKATILSLCWVGLTACGAMLIYRGVEKHEGKLKSKHTLKIGIGASCIALAIYAISKHFEPCTQNSI